MSRAPWTIGGIGPDGIPKPVGPWWAERGLSGASARRWAPESITNTGDFGSDDYLPDDSGPIAAAERSASSGAPFAFMAGVVLAILMFSAHFLSAPVLARVLVPVCGFLAVVAASRWLVQAHPDEPWLSRLMVLAVLAKIFGSVMRYRTLVNSYGEVGDATVFDTYGHRYSKFWLGQTNVVSELDNIRKSNFVRWFTGVVYYLFGADMIAGFIVFGLLAFVGSYLWYRASVEAVPFVDKRLYFIVVMFVPSILFWPSSIGKEALMQFAIGSAALGTAHLFNGKLMRGVLVALPGAWLLWVVRPHLLAMVTLSAAVAYLIGRGPRARRTSDIGSSLVKPIGLVLVAFVAVFAIGQGAKSLGLPSLTLDSVQTELDDTTLSTQQGSSSFQTSNSLSPLHLPQGMATVLLRPFPWEVDTPLQTLASFEGIALIGFIIWRRKSIAISLRHLRSVPFLVYCWTLTILYSVTFQAFANFGLLVRQRSLVLPALYVLVCLDTRRAREFDDEQRERAALRAQQLARGGL